MAIRNDKVQRRFSRLAERVWELCAEQGFDGKSKGY